MTKQAFLSTIEDVVQTTGKFPKVEYLSQKFGIPQYKISGLLKQLSITGELIRVNNWYRLPSQIADMSEEKIASFSSETKEAIPEQKEAIEESENIVKDAIEQAPVIESNKIDDSPMRADTQIIKRDYTLDLLSWILFTMGIGAAIASAYYSQIYLAAANKPFAAWFLSILMVTFSSIVFVLIALMISKKITVSKWRYVLVAIFSLLWVITTSYSIAATVAGQFNQRAVYMESKIQHENNTLITSNAIDQQRELRDGLEASRNDARTRLNNLFIAADIALKTPELIKESWTSIQSRIVATQETIKALGDKIEASMLAERELIKNNPEAQAEIKKQKTFAQWIASFNANGNEEAVQLLMTLFPAIFLDIIAPIFLTLFIFIRKREKGNDTIQNRT